MITVRWREGECCASCHKLINPDDAIIMQPFGHIAYVPQHEDCAKALEVDMGNPLLSKVYGDPGKKPETYADSVRRMRGLK